MKLSKNILRQLIKEELKEGFPRGSREAEWADSEAATGWHHDFSDAHNHLEELLNDIKSGMINCDDPQDQKLILSKLENILMDLQSVASHQNIRTGNY
jgi:hypothetical protein|tara:strand:- start:226 stop:519 length:294 start_codon:yes stop_codon:yes gene_type:complete